MKSKRRLLHFRICLAAANLFFFLLAAPFVHAQQQFLAVPNYASAVSGSVAAVGDFNKDGKLDVVSVSGNTIGVLLGNGDGTFQSAVINYGLPWSPYAVVVGDFNGDGNLDVGVASFSNTASLCSSQCQGLVSIFLGNGDGTFRPRMDFQTGGLLPWSMAVGDFNGDGKLDLVISNAQGPGQAVSVLLGHGDGTFEPPVNYSTGGSPGSLAVGDFNGDGKPDLALVSANIGGVGGSVLTVYLNKGDGTFHTPVSYATADNPSTVVVADVNGDGKPDLVVDCFGGVSVLLGKGDGTFQPHLDYKTSGLPGNYQALVIADFNGDGKPDLALSVDFGTLAIGFGNGDGTFKAPVYYVAGTGFHGPGGLVLGDFNGDRKPDLAVSDGSRSNVLLNDGKGGFKAARSFPIGDTPQGIAMADLNGDGKLDLVVGTVSGVSVMLGNGNGTFGAEVDYTGGGTGIGDFNGDGIPDLSNGATVLLGKGDGTFGAPIGTGVAAGAVAVADFNGDGKLDLAVANSTSSITVLSGRGNGSFGAAVTYATGLGPLSITVADFNGDGKPDLAVAFSSGIDIFINRGDGTFLPAVVYPSGGVPTAVAVGDFNRDGHTDLAVANGAICHSFLGGACSGGSTLAILVGNGDGTFRPAVTYPAGVGSSPPLGPSSIVVADFNGDGKQDLAVANPSRDGTMISLLWGDGDATFRPHLDYHVGSSPVSVAAGDLNGDSKPDLTVALGGNLGVGTAVSVLLNTASGPANVLSAAVASTGPDFGGTVSSQPGLIMCGDDCAASYLPGTAVTLLAQPIPGYALTGWSGDCTGTGSCVVDLNADRSVVANFSPTTATFTLKIVFAGSGSGAVGWSISPPACTGTCSMNLPAGTNVIIGAVPASGSTFGGWNGAGCTPRMFDCNVTMNSDVTVTAAFNSTGPAQVTVPNVVDMTQSTAMSAITSAGLVVGTVARQSASSVASGDVISESPSAGTNAARGTAVDLVVSSGDPSAGGSSGGGGGMDLLTLAALLGSLVAGPGRGGVRFRLPAKTPTTHIDGKIHVNTKGTFSVGLLLLAILVPLRLGAQAPRQPEAQIRYSIRVLGSLGGTNCCLVITNNNRGWVNFTSNLPGDQNFHPALWRNGPLIDLGTLGGPNASVGGMNDLGDVTVGGADTGIPDPLGEDACGFGTYQTCPSYVWHQGKRTSVPTLGGNNGDISTINNRGDVLGFAETADADPTCVTPQLLRYEAFNWRPRTGEIRVLHPLAGDSDSAAFDMNDRGQGVGFSGSCGTGLADFNAARHAVIWQDGKPTDLGNFGGTIYNVPLGINNRGDVVGISAFPGNTVGHAFLWTNGHMTDLGTLPGDVVSLGNRINDDRVVAVQSCDANLNCRAAIWRDGVMVDLNALIPSNSQLFLEVAASINSRGEIVGNALDQESGATVPFLAIPCDRQEAASGACSQAADDASVIRQRPVLPLPDNLRQQRRRQRGFDQLGTRGPGIP